MSDGCLPDSWFYLGFNYLRMLFLIMTPQRDGILQEVCVTAHQAVALGVE